MKTKIIAIVANGEPVKPDLLKTCTRDADLIIAADGGMKTCRAAGIVPDYIVGDLDSGSDAIPPDYAADRIITNSDQDTTDLEKAVTFAGRFEPILIRFFSVVGLRTDHAMANMIMIQNFGDETAVEMYDNFGVLKRLHCGTHTLPGKPGRTVSFFTMNPVQGLSLTGFEFPLHDHNEPVSFYGISNRYDAEECTVRFESGILLMYELFEE